MAAPQTNAPINQEVKMTTDAQPVSVVSTQSPPAYLIPQQQQAQVQQPQQMGEKQLPALQQQQQQVPILVAAPAQAAAVVADNAISADAIRMSYMQYVTIREVKKANVNGPVPQELTARGLTQTEYAAVLTQVKQIKGKSDGNKIALWVGMIFCCGIIGYLLVSQRALGNKELRKQLETPLEDHNRKLMARGVPIRWTWIDGSLRAYYK